MTIVSVVSSAASAYPLIRCLLSPPPVLLSCPNKLIKRVIESQYKPAASRQMCIVVTVCVFVEFVLKTEIRGEDEVDGTRMGHGVAGWSVTRDLHSCFPSP